MQADPGEITTLLVELKQGDKQAEARLIPLVYGELLRIARLRLRHEQKDHSLQPTALVHEAYLRLTRMDSVDWQGRSHFFAVSATLMRRILVDHARANMALKHGGGAITVCADDVPLTAAQRGPEIIALDDALHQLEALNSRQAKIVELRFFAGMSEDEIADVLHITERTVRRDWRVAKAWLFKELDHAG